MTKCWVCKKDPMDEVCLDANRKSAAVAFTIGLVGSLVYGLWWVLT